MEAEAAKRKSHQSTMSKAVKNLVRQARGVVEQIHEIEMGERRSTYHPAQFRVVGGGRREAKLLLPLSLMVPKRSVFPTGFAWGCHSPL